MTILSCSSTGRVALDREFLRIRRNLKDRKMLRGMKIPGLECFPNFIGIRQPVVATSALQNDFAVEDNFRWGISCGPRFRSHAVKKYQCQHERDSVAASADIRPYRSIS